ncbi:DNA damage-regulated autophagy modulator protein 2-like [Panonychus citri]|uniref:DNA damage-regulated autophagy modulator protein 2-like n=1 Tax=Panonychus citri TaxID=50023 RepID=UPI0023079B4B|nr:DNA damage-regulated autophagy modulator protein 2-like [Panonychus citri]
MIWANVHWIPLAAFILLPTTFITTYALSVYLHDVAPEFPYISDTGTNSPESCIFSQFLNITAFLYLFTIYLRYKQIEQYYRDHLSLESPKIMSRNRWSLFVGVIACLGLSIVANFQETNLIIVHLIGAFTCFGCGMIYCWIQTWISFKAYPIVNSRSCAIFRFFLCTIMTITFVIQSVCGPLAFKFYDGDNPRKWTIKDGGYWLHISASIAEWIMALSLDIFIGTYITEMRKISMSSPKVLFLVENVNILSANYPFTNDDQVEVYHGSNSPDSLRRDINSLHTNFRNRPNSGTGNGGGVQVGSINNQVLIH